MKKRILLVVNKDLPKRDYRFLLASYDNILVDFAMPSHGITSYGKSTIYDIPLSGGISLINDTLCLISLSRIIISSDYNVVHWFSSKYYLIGPLLTRLLSDSKSVITINGLGRVWVDSFYRIFRPLFKVLLRFSVASSSHVIVQNRDDLNFLESLLHPRTHISVIYSAVPELQSNYRLKQHRSPHKDVRANRATKILNVSRLSPGKGIEDFLYIAFCAHSAHPGLFKFILIGYPDDSSLLRLVSSAASQGYVDYYSDIDDPSDFYESSDVMLFTSHREGLPRALIEASCFSLPIAAFDVPGVREVVVHEHNGYLAKLKDISSLIKFLLTYSSTPRLLQEHGIHSRELYETKFSPSMFLFSMKKIYESC